MNNMTDRRDSNMTGVDICDFDIQVSEMNQGYGVDLRLTYGNQKIILTII